MTEKKFTVHIKWFNYEKTEGEIELFDNGQPLLVSESIEDVQIIKCLLNELHEENEVLKQRLRIYKNDGLETLKDLEKAYENNKKALNNIEQLEKEKKELKTVLNIVLTQLYDAQTSLIYEYSTNINEDEKELDEYFKDKYGKYGWSK